ncbi:solute carrier family 12 member 2-like isoform X2 [Apostichopus japonicus]|uniref:solute carrier family 12 member 2-like isoform X2 n=1 Tax=Stichopus japonicus TaxID=307972 RepID=UPI003AB45323
MATFKLGDEGSSDSSLRQADPQDDPPQSSPKQSRFEVNVVSEDPSSDPGNLEASNHKLGIDDASFEQSMQMHTLGQMTMEAKPSIENYRNMFSIVTEPGMKSRPTLQDLHDPKPGGDINGSPSSQNLAGAEEGTPSHNKKAVKFGWIKGVLVRCLLNIWGVMLFLRLSWVVGQSGILCATCIVLLSAVVTCLTTISMSAICTNGEVKGGGAYYMISRSLGPEFGGSIGLIFSMANAVAVAMYVVGFAETVRDVLVESGIEILGYVHDVRLIGEVTLVLILCIALIGTAWEARAQIILLIILLLSMVNMIVGSFLPPTEEKLSKGFVGYKFDVLKVNLLPDYTDGYNFFLVFSIFFPAATGILAGANISGDLRDAQKAIPKGTFSAIWISTIVYALIAWLFGAVMVREASGNIDDVGNGTVSEVCIEFDDCEFGLSNDYRASRLIAGWGPLVLAGIFSATLSSALASMVSAPKVFQAVCKDKIFPKVEFFAVGSGASDEPKRAYFLTYFIAAGFTAVGALDTIAPLISNFFLMSYALINFSCFSASLAQSPGWRPAFKFYNMWVALLASAMCVGVMFLINWWAALITIVVVTALYAYVKHTKPEINWGSSNQAFIYKRALDSTLQLNRVPDHIKTFRPQILVLTGEPDTRPALLRFVNNITKNNSLLLCGNVSFGDQEKNLQRLLDDHSVNWLAQQKIKGFPAHVTATSLRTGVQSLLQLGGLGKIKPNLVVLGFKNDWATAEAQQVEDYVGIIHDSFDMNLGVAIFRIKEGFDVSSALNDPGYLKKMKENSKMALVTEVDINIEVSDADDPGATPLAPLIDSTALIKCQPNQVIKSVQLFQGKGPKGQIHVWWLFDDGGLTLLVPYLLTIKSHWEKCTLKIFTGGKKDQLNKEKQNMASLLNKFRIDHDSVEIIPDIGKTAKKESKARFEERIKPLRVDKSKGESRETHPWKITDDELDELRDKTNRQLRLQELLFEHSKDAQLIVMSLPMPRKKSCSAYLYMSWLETLSQDLPPMLLMRGNQTSVLTYYS